jgi:hypothetical protein
MLINDSQLDIAKFREFFPQITWTKLPRTLGPDHKEFFYTGIYEDDEKRVNLTIRPSKIMAISETYKNRLPMDGGVPPENYRGAVVEWGASVELKVDDKFIAEVETVAQKLVPRTKQTLEW